MRNIKSLKPTGKYRHGDFRSFKPKKYLGDINKPIVYRSGYELKFMRHLEFNPNVMGWNSENIVIPYYMIEMDSKGNKVRKRHNYHMDMQVQMNNGKWYLCEVKPMAFVPLNESQIKRSPEHYKNACKWKAAIEWCKKNNHEFKLITEDQLKKPLT